MKLLNITYLLILTIQVNLNITQIIMNKKSHGLEFWSTISSVIRIVECGLRFDKKILLTAAIYFVPNLYDLNFNS